MRPRLVLWAALLGLSCGLAGCQESYESLVQESLGTWQDAVTALASIQDEASAERAGPQLRQILFTLEDQNQRTLKARRLSLAEEEKLLRKHREKVAEILTRINEEGQRAAKVPGAKDSVLEFNRGIRRLMTASMR